MPSRKPSAPLLAEYTIKESANLYIQLFKPQAPSTCEAQLSSVKTLIRKLIGASIQPLEASNAKSAGCVVNAETACYLLMEGHEDIGAEINKAKVRLAKANESVVKHRKIMEGLEKAGKLESEVAETQSRRLEDAIRGIEVLEWIVSQFERLKLE